MIRRGHIILSNAGVCGSVWGFRSSNITLNQTNLINQQT